MNEKDFLKCVCELVDLQDTNDLDINQKTSDIQNFDSMTIIGIITWADDNGYTLSIDDFKDCVTLKDIYCLMVR